MSESFAIEDAVFLALFFQAITYGFFASLFAQSTSIILTRRKRNPQTIRVNTMLFIVSTLMFLLSTVYISFSLYRYIRAFKPVGDTCGPTRGQIDAWLGNENTVSYTVPVGAYGIQTVMGDGFMIYRTYMVWGQYLPVCIPVLLTWLVSTVCGLTFIFTSSHASVWVLLFLWLTWVTNGCCTVLIAGRIIWLRRQIRESGGPSGSDFGPTVTIIVESGAIYSFFLTIVIALYYPYGLTNRNLAVGAMPHVMGIIFSFIIIRVASRLSTEAVVSESGSPAQQHTALTEMFQTSRRED